MMSQKRSQIGLRIPPDLLARIEDWRAAQRPIPTLADAARQLIERGLGPKPRRSLKDMGLD